MNSEFLIKRTHFQTIILQYLQDFQHQNYLLNKSSNMSFKNATASNSVLQVFRTTES